MKRLLIALVAAVAVSTVFARNIKQGFETDTAGFVAVGQGDESEQALYGDAEKPTPLAGLFDSAGSYFLDIDTGDATLWCTNSGDATYFDMNMQFNVSTTEPVITEGTKLAVYLNPSNKLVVVSKGATNITDKTLTPGTWGRLTIEKASANTFKVYLNAALVGTYDSITDDATITSVGFNGSGALDNYVARTTDPFLQSGPSIGGEYYASYSDALADALAGVTATVKPTITLADGTTTMDGTAAKPYQIQDAASLIALQNAVFANAAVRSLNYVQTANINMTGVDKFYGIGWFTSSDSYASLPAGVTNKQDIAFSGVYDGNGKTISNVTIVRHNYAGVFNNISGTVKDLTVQDIGFSGTCSEWGCAIVGNAASGALLENLTATSSSGFNWGDTANHNVAGVVVRPIGAATIRGCVNNANITASGKRVGGVAAFVGSGSTGTVFDSCTNTAAIISSNGTRGVGGILGCAEGGTTDTATIIRNCVDFGSETAQAEGGHAGAIVGSNWNGSYTYTDDGGNIFKASTVDCGYDKNAVFGRAYAVAAGTIDGVGYLMTVKSSDLAKNNTYTLMTDIAASETPVIELDDAGDTIAFDLNGHTFAGTVTVKHDGVTAEAVTSGSVTTYTATITDAWAYRLGAPVNGAYEIDNLAELKAFQAGVAVPLTTAGKTFKLMADIELDAAWPGIGVQNGKDDWNTDWFNNGAFQGTFDGQNYTISGFQMVGGNLDYCGFFNSIYNATIQNLKIQYAGALFAADTTASTTECGATFVGVAKESTLSNLTSLQKDAQTGVSCGKGFGGVAGFVTEGTTVEYCTNNVNVTSLAKNKAGGVVMITQGGSGTATIRNCVNNGTTTGNNNQKGGIIGYLGTDGTVVIENCIDNAGSTPTFFSRNKGTVTVSGVNQASASVVPCRNTSGATIAVSGLTFATVDNGVATFVADNALAAGNTYKVMAPGTATFEFAEAGTIAFDTALATPTFAITAANGLDLSDATEGTVKTYTATETYTITFISGEGSTTNTATYLKGETVTAPTPATVNGKTFSGWDSEVVTPAAADATYTAEYAFDNYAIAYLNEDGSAFTQWADNYAAPTNYTIATAVTLPTASDVELGTGVTFGGWTNETGTVTGWAAGQTGAVTVYAKLDPVTAPVIPANSDTTEIDGTGEEIATDVADAVAVGATTEAAAAIATAVESDPTYDYQANFTKTAVYNNESGKWEVTAKIADDVEKAVNEDAVAELLEAAVDSETTAVSVAVPAGLYYRVTTYDAIGGTPVQTKTGLSAGTTEAVNKPTTAGKGFIKVEMGTKSYED